MTVLEKQTMEAVGAYFRANTWAHVDWDQRRYEIAKDCIVALMPTVVEQFKMASSSTKVGEAEKTCQQICISAVNMAVDFADSLVEKLKDSK